MSTASIAVPEAFRSIFFTEFRSSLVVSLDLITVKTLGIEVLLFLQQRANAVIE